ncbi:MAG: ATP-grasp domain-containing protein [Lachnospiraceae bacterium]|nr:ATP-grasp domain-containing protein [Lachnospiraceae bacterium]
MNVLILSVGTRNKLIRYFVKAMDGKGRVIATDMCRLAPALYEADGYYIVPGMDSPEYLDVLFGICQKEGITGILSLIDPELSLLARNAHRFQAMGVTVIGSPYKQCELALDKFKMYEWLQDHGYRCAKSYRNQKKFYRDVEEGKIIYPVFVKPAKGSASIAVSKVYDKEMLDLLFMNGGELMVQEFLDGQEIGADVYVDMLSHKVVSIFTKKKLKMRAGETDKAVSFKDSKLFGLIERFVAEAGFLAAIDIDLFEVGGEYYISEINPRFGGGYPHAYACGVDHVGMVAKNLAGRANEKVIGDYEDGVYMMKFNELCIRQFNRPSKKEDAHIVSKFGEGRTEKEEG